MSDSCNPVDCSLPGSVHGILQARILEWVAISFSRGYSWPRDWTQISCIAGSLLHCRQILYWLNHQGTCSQNLLTEYFKTIFKHLESKNLYGVKVIKKKWGLWKAWRKSKLAKQERWHSTCNSHDIHINPQLLIPCLLSNTDSWVNAQLNQWVSTLVSQEYSWRTVFRELGNLVQSLAWGEQADESGWPLPGYWSWKGFSRAAAQETQQQPTNYPGTPHGEIEWGGRGERLGAACLSFGPGRRSDVSAPPFSLRLLYIFTVTLITSYYLTAATVNEESCVHWAIILTSDQWLATLLGIFVTTLQPHIKSFNQIRKIHSNKSKDELQE